MNEKTKKSVGIMAIGGIGLLYALSGLPGTLIRLFEAGGEEFAGRMAWGKYPSATLLGGGIWLAVLLFGFISFRRNG